MSFRPRGRQSVAAAAQRPYVLMLLCSSVFRVSGFRTPATASAFMPSALAACPQILEKHVLQHKPAKYPPQNLAYTQVNPTFAPLDIKIPACQPTGKSALLPASGRKRSCPPPESAKLRDFFLHAATRWHSARYVRFKRNFRKFLQNFFAKNLVCVPKVRTFALANQK